MQLRLGSDVFGDSLQKQFESSSHQRGVPPLPGDKSNAFSNLAALIDAKLLQAKRLWLKYGIYILDSLAVYDWRLGEPNVR
jgi:hypothetical protein